MNTQVLSNSYKVLIVEDFAEDRAILKRYLNQDHAHNYQFEETKLGKVGLETCLSWLPDFILLAYKLPDMQALEFLEALTANGKELPCPVIIITGRGNETIAAECIKHGAEDYLIKNQLTAENLHRTIQSGLISYERKKSERYALQTKVLESISDAFYSLDSEERLTYINRKAEELWNMRREDLLGKKIREVFPDLEKLPAYPPFRKALTEQIAVEFETYSTYIQRWVKTKVYPADGGVSIYIQDITAQKQVEEQLLHWNEELEKQVKERTAELEAEIAERKRVEVSLKESETVYYGVLDALWEGVVLHDKDGAILRANASAERILGIPASHIINRTSFDPAWQAIHKDGTPYPGETHPAMVTLQSGKACRGEIMGIRWPDNTLKWLYINTQPLFEPDGTTIRGAVASIADFTKYYVLAQAMSEREENYRLLAENSLDIVFKNDPNGKTLYVSPACKNLLGYEPEELIGQSVIKHFHPDDKAVVRAAMKESRNNAGKIRFEYRYRRKDGNYIWLEAYSYEVTDPETGAKLFSTGTARDITARKEMEEALKKSEENYRLLTENSLDIVFKNDLNGRTLYISPASKTLLGYEPEELIGLSALDLFHPDDLSVIKDAITESFANSGKIRVEYRYRRKDGNYIWLEAYSHGVYDPETGVPLFSTGMSRDITARKEMEETLRESEERYHSLFDNNLYGALLAKLDGTILTANPAACQMLGYREQEILALGRTGIVDRSETQIERDHEQLHLHNLVQRETVFIHKNGTRIICEDSTSLYRDKNGTEQLCIVIKNITERKQAEEALRESEEIYRSLFDNNLYGVHLANPKGEVKTANRAACQILGYEEAEIIALGRDGLFDQSDPRLAVYMENRLKYNTIHAELNFVRKDGTIINCEIARSRYVDKNNQERSCVVFKDITERKRAELVAKRYQLLSENTLEIILFIRPDGSILEANRAAALAYGYSAEELLTLNLRDLVAPQTLPFINNHLKQAVNGNFLFETLDRRKDGTLFPVEVSSHSVELDNQPVLLRVIRDISDRKRAEEQLRLSEERFRAFMDNSPASSWIVDSEWKMVYLSQPHAHITGMEIEKALGKSIYELFPREIADEHVSTLQTVKAIGKAVEVVESFLRPDGTKGFGLSFKFPLPSYSGQQLFGGVSFDITERILAEEALRLSEESYRFLADSSTDIITKLSPDSTLEYVSPVCQKIVGFTPEELIGQPIINYIHPDDLGQVQKVLASWREQGHESLVTFRAICKNGQNIWMEASIHFTTDPTTGQLLSIIAIARNLTERRKKEEAFLEQERLRVALQKEQELSQMKSKMMVRIAHEFRTPLSIILSASETLTYYMDRLTPEKRKYYTEITHHAIEHITSMLDDITFAVNDKLTFQDLTFSSVKLEEVCRQVIVQLQNVADVTQNFSLNTEEKVERVVADEGLINYAIHNLLHNAAKYSPQGSTIWLKLTTQGEEAVLEVKDEGIGISKKDQERIFEPFYRGSNINEVGGIGLGLCIVKRVVELHQGSIEVISELKQGTTFILRLPFSR